MKDSKKSSVKKKTTINKKTSVKNNKKRKEVKKSGFTLVELLATVIIIAVVGGIAATVYLANIEKVKQQSTILAINNVKSAAELFSKDNANSINWIYSYDAGGNNITGQYACISVLQLINQGYFKKDFFKKDIYEDQLNNNSLITIKKGINANDYETGIFKESYNMDQCELSMMNKVLKMFQIDGSDSYSDRIIFNVSVKNKRVESNNFIFNYDLPNSETLNHTGECSGGKNCLMKNLDKKTSYKVRICLNTGEENICDTTTFNTKDINKPIVTFNPTKSSQPRYYYRDVAIKYDPTTIYGNVAQRYFKTLVNGKLASNNTGSVYLCSNFVECSSTRITNNILNADKLYKLVGSDSVSFTISEDATNKKVQAYLRDSKNESTKEQTIPPIKTTFNVNYSGGNGATGSVSSHTCKYNNNCTLNTNGFTKPGYQFVSWRYNGETVNNPLNQTTMLNDDSMTLVAYWNTISYTINYNLDGGTHGSSHPTTGSFNNLVTISNPTKSGKVFTGWTSSTSSGLGSSAKTGITDSPSTAWTGTATKNTYFKNLRDQTGTVTLTANWSNTNYTISYDLGGGTHGSNHPTTGSVGGVVTISNPIKLGYTFTGWTASTSSGLGSSAKTGTTDSPNTAWTGTVTKNTYFKDLRSDSGTVTLTANWTRNFTCAAAGSNTDYMGRSWYTNSNDGTYCDLSLNDKVGASGGNSYNNATNASNGVYYYIKDFTNTINKLSDEKDAGLVDSINTDSGSISPPTGIFWVGNSTIYDSSDRTKYNSSKPSSTLTLYAGSYYTTYTGNKHTVTSMSKRTFTFNTDFSSDSLPAGTRTVSNSSSKYTISDKINKEVAITSSDLGGSDGAYASNRFTTYAVKKLDSYNNFTHYLYTQPGNNEFNADQNETWFKPCGGKKEYQTMLAWHVGARSGNRFQVINRVTGKDEFFAVWQDATDKPLLVFAGTASSTTKTNEDGVNRYYKFRDSSNCRNDWKKASVDNTSYDIFYRPHIRVKM